MPGILLNRLSRPKANEMPSEQLSTGRSILLGEMLPVICPNGKEGQDYLYLEDIESRMSAHKEGNILDRALQLMRHGRCDWLAVTEIPRLTGDLGAAAEILALCKDHHTPIYTREHLHRPYEPWRPESEQELFLSFMISGLEVIGFRGRVSRTFAAAYPLDAKTGEQRIKSFASLGRHMNGKVPTGYVWNKMTKTPEINTAVPCPDYLPLGAAVPPAKTWWEVVQRVFELGFKYGSTQTSTMLSEETGVKLPGHQINNMWSNPFYAGRPTSRYQMRGGRLVKRPAAEHMATQGEYPAVLSWEDYGTLLEIIEARRLLKPKTMRGSWASGVFRCACGEPYLSARDSYMCRALFRTQANASADRLEVKRGVPIARAAPPPADWQRTETCGEIRKYIMHDVLTNVLREIFARPDLHERVAEWQQQRRANSGSHLELRRQQDELHEELRRLQRQREKAQDAYLDDLLSKAELQDRIARMDKEKHGIEARLCSLKEMMTQPSATPADVDLIRRVLTIEFDDFWNDPDLKAADRAIIAQNFIDHIPVTGRHRSRTYGKPVLATWLGDADVTA